MTSYYLNPRWTSCLCATLPRCVNTLRPRQNGRHFPDDIFTCIFLNENVRTFIKISLKFVAKGPINNIPALVQIMAWRRPGDKPLSEPMMVRFATHIRVTRPQWVNKWTWQMIIRTKCSMYWRYLQMYFLNEFFPFCKTFHRNLSPRVQLMINLNLGRQGLLPVLSM